MKFISLEIVILFIMELNNKEKPIVLFTNIRIFHKWQILELY